MREPLPGARFDVRPFRDEDEPRVRELLITALGSGPIRDRPPGFFRWKHRANPFGRSFMLVAEADGGIVGLRAFMRWRFRTHGRTVRAVRAVDTATHPDYRSVGVFSRLTRQALDALRGEVDLVFNTPNAASLPGYLKMGWQTAGRIPVAVRIRRPMRFLRWMASVRAPVEALGPRPAAEAETAAEALDDPGAGALFGEDGAAEPRLRTPRELDYLRWRYASAPSLDYRAVREHRNGALCGLAIFRVRPRGRLWESTVVELIGPAGDLRTSRRLLRRVIEAAAVDHVACSFPAGTAPARAARRCGFLRSPAGVTLAVNPLEEVDPDPRDLRSWALSLGDLEVF